MVKDNVVFVEESSDLFPDMVNAVGRVAVKDPSLFEEFRGTNLLGAELISVSGEKLEETLLH